MSIKQKRQARKNQVLELCTRSGDLTDKADFVIRLRKRLLTKELENPLYTPDEREIIRSGIGRATNELTRRTNDK